MNGYEEWLTEIGPGWHALVRPLIKRCLDEGVCIYRIKQKFGGLRFDAATGTSGKASAELRRVVQRIERQSLTVCEQCGEPGIIRDGPCIRTLCNRHVLTDQELPDIKALP